MKYGNVVKINNLDFLDETLNDEGYKRKCIILYETEYQLCVCPIITNVNSFNKNPKNYYFLPNLNNKSKKLTFAKISNIVFINKYDVVEVIDYLDNYHMNKLIEKIKDNYSNYEKKEYYSKTLEQIEEKTLVK